MQRLRNNNFTRLRLSAGLILASVAAVALLAGAVPAAPVMYAYFKAEVPHTSGRSVKPSKGKVLVASPGMRDPRFAGSRILITGYGPEGALGLVLNRPTDATLSEGFPGAKGLEGATDTIFWGGPLENNLIFILVRSPAEPEGAAHVIDDLYISASPNLLHRLLVNKDRTEDLRVYAGYAGWAPGQLDTEVSLGAWQVVDADVDSIFRGASPEVWTGLGR